MSFVKKSILWCFFIAAIVVTSGVSTTFAKHHATSDKVPSTSTKPALVKVKNESIELRADKLKNRYNLVKTKRMKQIIVRTYKRLTGNEFPKQTIVDIAIANKDFSTLVAAVSAANLVNTLQGSGPFTVFAPTNSAFAKIDSVTLASLLTKEKLVDLTSILTYHVVPGNIRAKDLSDGMELVTVQGAKLKVSIKDGVVKINNSIVTATDIEGRNGFIHVIDTVLIPQSPTAQEIPNQTIVDIAIANKDFSTLVAAVSAANLVNTLQGSGPFTVFAPTNSAFAKIDSATLSSLLTKEKLVDLTSILTYHVVPGNIKAKDLSDGMELVTVQGAKLKVSIKDGVVKINNSIVTATDIEATNGFIHVIDTVLLP